MQNTHVRPVRDLRNRYAINPNMFPKYEYNEEYRKMVTGDFLVIYKTDEANNQVYIYRILHGK